jgi:hypothetical protein
MVKRIAAVLFGLVLLAVPASAVRQPMKYAFLLTIDNTDSRNNVIGTIRGNGSLLDLVEGRDQESSGGDTWFNRYVLKPSLLPAGTPEIAAVAFVGINAGVPAVVRNEYSQNSILWRTVEFRGYTPAVGRQFMQDYLRNLAHQNGATHIWHIIPGDSLSGDLLSHFTPIQ